jgi:hypothetical protein
MNAGKRILLLNGSPKATGGTSWSMGDYLLDGLRERGCLTEALRIKQALASEAGVKTLLSKTAASDTLILVSPLYIDTLPYPVIKTLELIAECRRALGTRGRQQFLAILNCGFPEARHNEIAVAVCRKFAEETGFEWAGSLALGGGEAINGLPLGKGGFLTRNVKEALDLAADALAEGSLLQEKAVAIMARPLMPAWLYLLMGAIGWKRLARKNHALKNIHDQPYAE